MGEVVVEITMSLDGYVAGPDPTLEDPLGKDGMRLHEWAFDAESWRELHGLEGGSANVDSELIEASVASTGAVIMGRKTFDSLPGLLPGRRHIVLTRDAGWDAEGAEVAHNVDEALTRAGNESISVIGGAEIFALFMPLADRI